MNKKFLCIYFKSIRVQTIYVWILFFCSFKIDSFAIFFRDFPLHRVLQIFDFKIVRYFNSHTIFFTIILYNFFNRDNAFVTHLRTL